MYPKALKPFKEKKPRRPIWERLGDAPLREQGTDLLVPVKECGVPSEALLQDKSDLKFADIEGDDQLWISVRSIAKSQSFHISPIVKREWGLILAKYRREKKHAQHNV